MGVSLGLFGTPDSAVVSLRTLPARMPARLSNHLVICPTLSFPPQLEVELERLKVVVLRVIDDDLNLEPRIDIAMSRLGPPSEVAGYDSTTGLRWGLGFHSVIRRGQTYDFTGPQAAVVEMLYEALANGTPYLHQSRVLDRVGSGARELRDLFRKHPAWGTFLVTGPTRGTFGLDP